MSGGAVGRLVVAGGACLGLAALLAWALRPGRIEGPARVEAALEYRVRHGGDGRVRWTLLDGSVPGGPVVIADGLVEGERGDPVSVEPAAGIAPGAAVAAGQVVARLSSSRLDADPRVVAAERDAVLAERALLEAGGRAEAVAVRHQAVAVASADLALQQARVEQLAALVEDGAEAAWKLEEARRRRDVREAELALARARLAEAREPPRPEEERRLDARLREIDARLAAAAARQEGQALRSPVDGIVAIPGEDVLVSVVGGEGVVIQVAIDEGARGEVHEGDPVDFVPTAAGRSAVRGRVLRVGDAASSLGGRPVVWVVARLDEPAPVGATGRGVVRPMAAP